MESKRLFFLLIILAILSGNAYTQEIPKLIFYQGNLANQSGNAINGSQDMVFSIWQHETSTDAADKLWEEIHTSVPVNNGLFALALGSQTPIAADVFSSSPRYLQITISGETLNPRQQIVSMPYSYASESVSGAENVFPSSGNIGIGHINPQANLHVRGGTDENNLIQRWGRGGNTNNHNTLELYKTKDSDGDWLFRMYQAGASQSGKIGFGKYSSTPWDGVQMLLDTQSGNVGIGTMDPL